MEPVHTPTKMTFLCVKRTDVSAASTDDTEQCDPEDLRDAGPQLSALRLLLHAFL